MFKLAVFTKINITNDGDVNVIARSSRGEIVKQCWQDELSSLENHRDTAIKVVTNLNKCYEDREIDFCDLPYDEGYVFMFNIKEPSPSKGEQDVVHISAQ